MSHDGKPLAEGFVTELGLQARVLGFRLVTIDATILVTPAAVEPVRRVAQRSAARRPIAGEPVGRDLARATRFIDEGRAALAAARENGTGRAG